MQDHVWEFVLVVLKDCLGLCSRSKVALKVWPPPPGPPLNCSS